MGIRCFVCAGQRGSLIPAEGRPVVAVKTPGKDPLYKVLCWTHRATHRRGFGKMALEALDGPDAAGLLGDMAVEVELDDPDFLDWARAAEVMST